jgi:hypothetical protein
LPDDNILCVIKDLHQNIWVGTYNQGLCKISFENGISTRQKPAVRIHPNLIQSGENIHLSCAFNGDVRMFDSAGRLMFETHLNDQGEVKIPLETLPGRYYISLSNKEQTNTVPIVVF